MATLELQLLFRCDDAASLMELVEQFAKNIGKAPLDAFSPPGLIVAVTGGTLRDVRPWEAVRR